LLKRGVAKGKIIAVDGTAIKAYSQRSLDNKTGKSHKEARWEEPEEASFLAIKCMRHAAPAVSCH